MKIQGKLISSQLYLDDNIIRYKVLQFTVFIINAIPAILRDKQYTLLCNGHHNYAAAKLIGAEPKFRIPKKLANAFSR